MAFMDEINRLGYQKEDKACCSSHAIYISSFFSLAKKIKEQNSMYIMY